MISKDKKNKILEDYCAGNITWRQAAHALGLDDFSAFESAIKEAGLRLYEPSTEESTKKMDALNALLDEGL